MSQSELVLGLNILLKKRELMVLMRKEVVIRIIHTIKFARTLVAAFECGFPGCCVVALPL